MMKKKLYLIAISALVFASCKIAQPPIKEVPIQYREKVVERLVPVQAPADSTSIEALFRCDSLNQVIMKSLTEQKGKGTSGFTFDKGALKYNFKTASELSYAKAKDSIIYREVPVKVPVEVKVNELTWWQKLWIRVGQVVGALGVVAIAVYFIKSKLNGPFKLFR
jgi:hypothetical protein